MFDIAWSELLVILVVALVVIGPKDLPRAMRVAGQWVRKARGLVSQFQGTVDAMVREAEMEEMRREFTRTQMEMERLTAAPHLADPAISAPAIAPQAIAPQAVAPAAEEGPPVASPPDQPKP